MFHSFFFSGYVRILLFMCGVWRAHEDDFVIAGILYSIHWVLDVADGIIARKYRLRKYQTYL